jgi:predicted branched-subunit amino acid permease
MFFLSSIRRLPEFRQGARDMSSVALGTGAWGLMTGVAMVKAGMSVFESIAMTLLVYAGSSQLAAIPLPANAAEERAQEAYLTGNYFVVWCSWMGMSVLGVVLANLIPQSWGLGFAGVLCLVAVVCSMATTRLRILAALIAGVTAVAAYALPLKLNIVAGIGVAVLLCFWLEKQFGLDADAEDDQ